MNNANNSEAANYLRSLVASLEARASVATGTERARLLAAADWYLSSQTLLAANRGR